MNEDQAGPDPNPLDSLSVAIRDAVAGNATRRSEVATRLAPLLRAQAIYRTPESFRSAIDPDDIVSDAWMVLLRRDFDVTPSYGRYTKVLKSFLTRTIVNMVNRRVSRLVRAQGREEFLRDEDGEALDPELAAATTAVVRRVARSEWGRTLLAALEALPERDRELIILRGIEGVPNQEAAEILAEKPNTVAQRYKRALARLRQTLPEVGDLFDD